MTENINGKETNNFIGFLHVTTAYFFCFYDYLYLTLLVHIGLFQDQIVEVGSQGSRQICIGLCES